MLRKLSLLAVGGLLLATVGLAASQDQPGVDPGLDLTACADLSGSEYGQCVAEAARAHAAAQTSNATAQAALELTAACADQSGAEFGACVADAAQALADGGAEDLTLPASARDLVLNCREQAGMDFGQCVADGARALGEATHPPSGNPGNRATVTVTATGGTHGGATGLAQPEGIPPGPPAGLPPGPPSGPPTGVPAGPPPTRPVIQPGPPTTVPPADQGRPTLVPPVQPGPPLTLPPMQPTRSQPNPLGPGDTGNPR